MTAAGIRRWHSYIGLFIAPSVLFFALTGAVQIFNLQAPHGTYQPPLLIEKLSSVHKNQVFAQPHKRGFSSGGLGQEASSARMAAHQSFPADNHTSRMPTILLKGFFLLVALGLIVTTPLGIWMGLTQIRRTRLAWILLIAGTVIPVALLLV